GPDQVVAYVVRRCRLQVASTDGQANHAHPKQRIAGYHVASAMVRDFFQMASGRVQQDIVEQGLSDAFIASALQVDTAGEVSERDRAGNVRADEIPADDGRVGGDEDAGLVV